MLLSCISRIECFVSCKFSTFCIQFIFVKLNTILHHDKAKPPFSNGEQRCTAVFRSLQRSCIGFRSRIWLEKFSLRITQYFSASIFTSILTSLPVPVAEKTSSEHDAAIIVFDFREGINEAMLSAWFPPQMLLGIVAKIVQSYKTLAE